MDGTPLALGINPVTDEGKSESAMKRLDKVKVTRVARVTVQWVKQANVVATRARAAEDQSRINTRKYREAL